PLIAVEDPEGDERPGRQRRVSAVTDEEDLEAVRVGAGALQREIDAGAHGGGPCPSCCILHALPGGCIAMIVGLASVEGVVMGEGAAALRERPGARLALFLRLEARRRAVQSDRAEVGAGESIRRGAGVGREGLTTWIARVVRAARGARGGVAAAG